MKRIAWVVLGVVMLAVASPARAEPVTNRANATAVRKLMATVRAPKTTSDRLLQAITDLVAIDPEGVAALDDHVTKEAAKLAAFVASRPSTGSLDEEINTLQKKLQQLRDDPDLSKEQLKNKGVPTLELLMTAWGKREAALAGWRSKRDAARGQADRLETIVTALATTAHGGPEAEHRASIQDVKQGLVDEDAETAKILADNASMAPTLPADLVLGMAAVNTIRIACGLHPLRYDPKLCDAGAMHSSDMASNGFFAHESPLPGKTSFTDRARMAGTTASGENIFMGSTVSNDAIKAWFVSPGHHKNMLGSGHTRQGLGRSGKHWTQLFGR